VKQNDGILAASRASRARAGAPKKALVQAKPATPRVTIAPKRAAPPRPAVIKAAPLADDLSPPAAGEVAVRVIRAGYSDPSGVQSQRGRLLNLPRDVAELAAKNGAVEIITPAPAPAPTPATEITP